MVIGSVHRHGGGSFRDLVIMIRDHIHELLSAESRLPFLSTRGTRGRQAVSLDGVDLAKILDPI